MELEVGGLYGRAAPHPAGLRMCVDAGLAPRVALLSGAAPVRWRRDGRHWGGVARVREVDAEGLVLGPLGAVRPLGEVEPVAWNRLQLSEREGRRASAVYRVVAADEAELHLLYDPEHERPLAGERWSGVAWGPDGPVPVLARVIGSRGATDPRSRVLTLRWRAPAEVWCIAA